MYLLVNPNSNPTTTRAICAIAAPMLPGVQGWTAGSGPRLITTPAELDRAATLVAAIRPPAGCRGIIVAAFGDPGAARLKRNLAIPVIGIGAAAARAAAADGRAFAVATTTPALAGRIDRLMGAHAEGGTYLGCWICEGDPVALMADAARLDAALLSAIDSATAAGAEAIIIGGGPLVEAAQRLARCSQARLIQPIQEAARLMASLDR